MGRLRPSAGIILAACLCLSLSGCLPRPGEIHTDLPYIENVVGGNTLGSSHSNSINYGEERFTYTYDEDGNIVQIPAGNYTQPGYTPEEIASIEAEYSRYWSSKNSGKPTAPQSDTSEPISTPLPAEITFETAHTYSDATLLAYYGGRNSRGFYSSDKSFYDKENDCWGINIQMTYADAVAAYTADYGTPSLQFENYTYWFMQDYAYCLHKDYYYTIWSISTYKNVGGDADRGKVRTFTNQYTNPSSIIDDAFVTYGDTYHFDYYNYIYNTPTGWLVIDRVDYRSTVI